MRFRSIKTLIWHMTKTENYRALYNFFKLYDSPFKEFYEELFGSHIKYPKIKTLKTPSRKVN